MSTADTITVAGAGVALVIGLVATVAMWRMQVSQARSSRSSRSRHPSASPPLSVALDDDWHPPQWRFDLRPGTPTTTIDIVSFRPSGGDRAWQSEPLVDPLSIEPGESASLPSEVLDHASSHDVVVAWTVHHPDGDVQGSGTFRVIRGHRSGVGTGEHSTTAGFGHRRSRIGLMPAVLAVCMVLTALLGWWLIPNSDESETSAALRTVGDGATADTGTSSGADGSGGALPSTTPTPTPTPTSAPTPTPDDPPDSPPTSTSRPPTTPSSLPESTTPTTDVPATSTIAPIPTMRVVITGRVEDCKFGVACVIASFSIVGFDSTSGNYTCEFADGSRVEFRFSGDGAEDACASSGVAPSITIEVDGVRSETITRDSVDA